MRCCWNLQLMTFSALTCSQGFESETLRPKVDMWSMFAPFVLMYWRVWCMCPFLTSISPSPPPLPGQVWASRFPHVKKESFLPLDACLTVKKKLKWSWTQTYDALRKYVQLWFISKCNLWPYLSIFRMLNVQPLSLWTGPLIKCKPPAFWLRVTQQLYQQMHKNVSARDVSDLDRHEPGRNSDCSTVRAGGGFVSLPAAVSNKVSLIADINNHIQRRQNIHCPEFVCVCVGVWESERESKEWKSCLLWWLAIRTEQVSV